MELCGIDRPLPPANGQDQRLDIIIQQNERIIQQQQVINEWLAKISEHTRTKAKTK